MSNYQKTRQVIYTVLTEIGFESKDLMEDSNIEFDLGIDSVEIVEIATALEKSFNINVDPQKLLEIETLGEVVKFIEDLKGDKQNA